MSKLYRVISNVSVEDHGVRVGDICTLLGPYSHGVAWFHNESWDDNGIWCLTLTQVEEHLEEK